MEPPAEPDKGGWVRTQAPLLRPTDRGGAARVERERAIRGPGLGKLPLSLPMREGWLIKQGFKNKNWRRRYFRTRINALFYFESPDATKPIGVIPLLDVSFMASATKPSQFHITHPQRRTFFLDASTAEEASAWLQTLALTSWDEGAGPWDFSDLPPPSIAIAPPVPYSFLASLPHCQLCGSLQKNKIGADTGWKRRWFILKENLLFYCKDAADIEPLGALDLEGCELRPTNRGNSFELFHRTRWSMTLLADSVQQQQLWISHLEYILKRVNGTVELKRPPPAGLERRITILKPDDMFPEFPPHTAAAPKTPPQSPRSPISRRDRILRILQEEHVERVQMLDCRDTGMGDEDVMQLRNAVGLTSLSLCGLPVTPPSVVNALSRLSNLTKLDMSFTPVNDECLGRLSTSLVKLHTLDLASTLVTDVGAIYLTAISTLKILNLQSTAVTATGSRALLQAETARLNCWQREGYLDFRDHGLIRDAWKKMWCSVLIQPPPVLVCKKDDKECMRVTLRPSCALAMADGLHPGSFVVIDKERAEKDKETAKEKDKLKSHLLFQAADASDMQRWVTALNSVAAYEWLVLYQDGTSVPIPAP